MDPKPRPNHKLYIEVLRQMTPEQRLRKAFELSARVKRLFHQGLRQQFPDLSEAEFHQFYVICLLTKDTSEWTRVAQTPLPFADKSSPRFATISEDTILAKLRSAKLAGGSEKQMRDALRVFEVQRKTIDIDYISQWATQLGVQDLWQQLQSEAEPV